MGPAAQVFLALLCLVLLLLSRRKRKSRALSDYNIQKRKSRLAPVASNLHLVHRLGSNCVLRPECNIAEIPQDRFEVVLQSTHF
jgi:hypothetical protein